MRDLIEEILRRSDSSEAVMVCVIVDTQGSTPQKAGATMLVMSNGQILGTLGGGCVEAEVRTTALRMLVERMQVAESVVEPIAVPVDEPIAERGLLLRFKLDNDYGWDDGLVCGGSMRIAMVMIDSANSARPWREALKKLEHREIATVNLNVADKDGEAYTFSHEMLPRAALVIAGAGHVAAALARVAAMLEFEVTVIDDRADFSNSDRFPSAACIVGEIDVELRRMNIDAQTFVVIVTRGHRHDTDALGAVIESKARYVGLIGSRRKILKILRELRARGVSDEHLARVHAPIGLAINAVTPGEIAVSIAAELVAVRRNCDMPEGVMMKIDTRLLG